ncbi:MAG: hypothetical protein JWQ40_2324 [Segetibacter sp.]|jgi:hypothetical protein|nr:hypothetical protein [Segetibacter sp.]
MRIVLCLIAGFVFIACSSSPVPKGILPPERMQKVVYDIMQVDEFMNNYVYKDTSIDLTKKRSILYKQVFKVHNTSRKEFYTSYKYYQQRPDIQKALFDSLYQWANRKKEDRVVKPLKPV